MEESKLWFNSVFYNVKETGKSKIQSKLYILKCTAKIKPKSGFKLKIAHAQHMRKKRKQILTSLCSHLAWGDLIFQHLKQNQAFPPKKFLGL